MEKGCAGQRQGDYAPAEEGCTGGRRDVVIEVHGVLNFSIVELVSLS